MSEDTDSPTHQVGCTTAYPFSYTTERAVTCWCLRNTRAINAHAGYIYRRHKKLEEILCVKQVQKCDGSFRSRAMRGSSHSEHVLGAAGRPATLVTSDLTAYMVTWESHGAGREHKLLAQLNQGPHPIDPAPSAKARRVPVSRGTEAGILYQAAISHRRPPVH
jgi:hypothetical protein